MHFNLAIENINYVKINCKDNSDNPWVIKAAIKRINEREIFACAKFENILKLSTPQAIELSFVCVDGLYFCKTNLKSVQFDAPYLFFAIEPPEDIEHRQQREFFRVKMNSKATISYLSSGKLIHSACQVYDISANGIRVITNSIPTDINEVKINIAIEDRNISAKAKYTRFDNEDDILKMAFQFIKIQQNDKDFISQQCLKQQLKNKRNSLSNL